MKGRSKRASGGTDEAAEDAGKKNMRYTYQSNVNDEAEERKRGGKAVGKVMGKDGMKHAGRKARKSGGRTGCESSPFTTASRTTNPPGRNTSGSLS